MRLWTISPQSLLLLSSILLVIVLVLVLPEVDLLETAFHLGTAPIVVHAKGTATPVFKTLLALFVSLLFAMEVTDRRAGGRWLVIRVEEVQAVNHSFRC